MVEGKSSVGGSLWKAGNGSEDALGSCGAANCGTTSSAKPNPATANATTNLFDILIPSSFHYDFRTPSIYGESGWISTRLPHESGACGCRFRHSVLPPAQVRSTLLARPGPRAQSRRRCLQRRALSSARLPRHKVPRFGKRRAPQTANNAAVTVHAPEVRQATAARPAAAVRQSAAQGSCGSIFPPKDSSAPGKDRARAPSTRVPTAGALNPEL